MSTRDLSETSLHAASPQDGLRLARRLAAAIADADGGDMSDHLKTDRQDGQLLAAALFGTVAAANDHWRTA